MALTPEEQISADAINKLVDDAAQGAQPQPKLLALQFAARPAHLFAAELDVAEVH